MELRMKL
ncbi:hypothetical protein AYI68_g7648, partial [Smittium mucronatum]